MRLLLLTLWPDPSRIHAHASEAHETPVPETVARTTVLRYTSGSEEGAPMAESRIVVRDRDGFPVDVILYPPPGWEEMFVPDPIWREEELCPTGKST